MDESTAVAITLPTIIGAIAFLIGMVLIGVAIISLKRMRESEGWPQVEGEIIESRVETRRRVVRRDRQRGSSLPSSEMEYTPIIKYRYKVRGVDYHGENIGFFQAIYPLEGIAQTITMEYPVGKQLPVYYDPWKPERSLLKRGVDYTSVAAFFFAGCIFAALGATAIVVF